MRYVLCVVYDCAVKLAVNTYQDNDTDYFLHLPEQVIHLEFAPFHLVFLLYGTSIP